jgi:hypothetical protein
MRRMFLIIALGAALGLVLVAMQGGGEEGPRLSVTFLTYSNSPSGDHYAIFAVTNCDCCDLELNGATVEFSGTDYGSPYSPSVHVSYSLAGTRLRRGRAYTMVTGVPPHHCPWRLSWMVGRHSLGNWMANFTSGLPLVPAYRNGTPDFFDVSTAYLPVIAQQAHAPTPR